MRPSARGLRHVDADHHREAHARPAGAADESRARGTPLAFGDGGPDFDPDRDLLLGYDYRDVDFLVEDPDHPFATLMGTDDRYGVVFMDGLEFTNGPPSWFSPEETLQLCEEILEAADCPLLGLEDFLHEAIAEKKGLLVGVD